MPALPRRADVVVPVIRDFVGPMGAATMLGSGRSARCTRRQAGSRALHRDIVRAADLKWKAQRYCWAFTH